ncbi:hypothetical protein C8Q75DRAFT_787128 [Abortiporus biennis]|nr:hypothetical protein C8Q75DRAFT_787128 [Abortiporus biennis]
MYSQKVHINQFSKETIREILSFYVEGAIAGSSSPASRRQRTKNLIFSTLVCSLWRKLVINTPEFWTGIELDKVDRASAFFERSKKKPVKIYGYFRDEDSRKNNQAPPTLEDVKSVSKLILANAYRIKRIDIGIPEVIRPSMRIDLGLFSILKSLKLHNQKGATEGFHCIPSSMHAQDGTTPSLRTLELKHVSIPRCSGIYRNLESLYLTSAYIGDDARRPSTMLTFIQMLADNPGLKYLDLSACLPHEPERPTNLLSGQQPYLDLSSYARIKRGLYMVKLSHLEHLDLFEHSQRSVAQFLASCIIPKTTRIYINLKLLETPQPRDPTPSPFGYLTAPQWPVIDRKLRHIAPLRYSTTLYAKFRGLKNVCKHWTVQGDRSIPPPESEVEDILFDVIEDWNNLPGFPLPIIFNHLVKRVLNPYSNILHVVLDFGLPVENWRTWWNFFSYTPQLKSLVINHDCWAEILHDPGVMGRIAESSITSFKTIVTLVWALHMGSSHNTSPTSTAVCPQLERLELWYFYLPYDPRSPVNFQLSYWIKQLLDYLKVCLKSRSINGAVKLEDLTIGKIVNAQNVASHVGSAGSKTQDMMDEFRKSDLVHRFHFFQN